MINYASNYTLITILFYSMYAYSSSPIDLSNYPHNIKSSHIKFKNIFMHEGKDNISYIPYNIPVYDKNSNKVYIESFNDHITLVVFYATWRADTVILVKQLDNLQKDFAKLKFKILPISQDNKNISAITNFYTEHQINNLPILHDRSNTLFRAMNTTTIPTAFLINEEGKILVTFKGNIMWASNEIRNILLRYIPNKTVIPRNTFPIDEINILNQSNSSNSLNHSKKNNLINVQHTMGTKEKNSTKTNNKIQKIDSDKTKK